MTKDMIEEKKPQSNSLIYSRETKYWIFKTRVGVLYQIETRGAVHTFQNDPILYPSCELIYEDIFNMDVV